MVNAKNTKNRILAISVALDEMPLKPNMPAIMAITKNMTE